MTTKQFSLWVLATLVVTSVTTITGCNLSPSFSKPQRTEDLTSTTIPTDKSWHKIQLLHTLTGNTEPIAISPNSQILASDGGYGKINLWNLRTGQLLRTLSGHSNSVMSFTFSPDGQTLVSGGIDKKIKIWHWDTGELIRTLSVEPYAVFSVDITPDGQTLVSGSGGEKNTLKIWNLKTGELLRTSKHSGAVESADISPDGQTLAVANRDGTIELWANGTGKLLYTLAKYPSGSGWFLVFSPDGQTIVGSSYNGEIKVWNSSTGKLMRTIAPLSVRIEDWLHTLIKQPNTVWAADISPDNQILASGSSDGKIKLWDLNTGHLLRILSGHSQLVAALVFSSDGQTLVSGSHDGIKIWRVPS